MLLPHGASTDPNSCLIHTNVGYHTNFQYKNASSAKQIVSSNPTPKCSEQEVFGMLGPHHCWWKASFGDVVCMQSWEVQGRALCPLLHTPLYHTKMPVLAVSFNDISHWKPCYTHWLATKSNQQVQSLCRVAWPLSKLCKSTICP